MKKMLDIFTLITSGSEPLQEPQAHEEFERERQYFHWELVIIYLSLTLTFLLLTTLYYSHQ